MLRRSMTFRSLFCLISKLGISKKQSEPSSKASRKDSLVELEGTPCMTTCFLQDMTVELSNASSGQEYTITKVGYHFYSYCHTVFRLNHAQDYPSKDPGEIIMMIEHSVQSQPAIRNDGSGATDRPAGQFLYEYIGRELKMGPEAMLNVQSMVHEWLRMAYAHASVVTPTELAAETPSIANRVPLPVQSPAGFLVQTIVASSQHPTARPSSSTTSRSANQFIAGDQSPRSPISGSASPRSEESIRSVFDSPSPAASTPRSPVSSTPRSPVTSPVTSPTFPIFHRSGVEDAVYTSRLYNYAAEIGAEVFEREQTHLSVIPSRWQTTLIFASYETSGQGQTLRFAKHQAAKAMCGIIGLRPR